MAKSLFALLTVAVVVSASDTCAAQAPAAPYVGKSNARNLSCVYTNGIVLGDTSGCGKYHLPIVNGIDDSHSTSAF